MWTEGIAGRVVIDEATREEVTEGETSGRCRSDENGRGRLTAASIEVGRPDGMRPLKLGRRSRPQHARRRRRWRC
jgi:hypothetical protein